MEKSKTCPACNMETYEALVSTKGLLFNEDGSPLKKACHACVADMEALEASYTA